jgi:hypothetical protein
VRHDVTGGGPGAQAQLHRAKYYFACSGSALESGAAERNPQWVGRWWLDASPSRTTNLILYGSSSPGPCSPGKAVRTVSEKPEVKDSRFSVVNLPWDSGLDCTAGPNFCMVHESISSHGLQLHLIHPHPMTEKKNNPAGFSRATWSTLHPATNGCSALAWTAHRRSAWRCMGPSCSVIGGW